MTASHVVVQIGRQHSCVVLLFVARSTEQCHPSSLQKIFDANSCIFAACKFRVVAMGELDVTHRIMTEAFL